MKLRELTQAALAEPPQSATALAARNALGGVTRQAVKDVSKSAIQTLVTTELTNVLRSAGMKSIPGIGIIYGLYQAGQSIKQGDPVDALLNLASGFMGVAGSMTTTAYQCARNFYRELYRVMFEQDVVQDPQGAKRRLQDITDVVYKELKGTIDHALSAAKRYVNKGAERLGQGMANYAQMQLEHRLDQIVQEFAHTPGPDGGNYLKALASAWYNNVYDTGNLDRGIKSQQDVERILSRGIHCGDGRVRKYYIDYNADFDGVDIVSHDYYEHDDDGVDSRTGKPWGPYDHVEYAGDDLDESLREFAPNSGDDSGDDDNEGLSWHLWARFVVHAIVQMGLGLEHDQEKLVAKTRAGDYVLFYPTVDHSHVHVGMHMKSGEASTHYLPMSEEGVDRAVELIKHFLTTQRLTRR